VPKINLIPPEYLPKPLLTKQRLMLLVVALELLLTLVVFQTYGENSQAFIGKLAGREPARSPEAIRADALNNQINGLRSQLNRLNSAEREIKAKNFQWPTLLKTFFSETTPGISVASVRQVGNEVALSGTSVTSEDIVSYSNFLQQSPNIASVTVLGIGGQSTGQGITFSFRIELKAGA
jgi:Tfp pilus assembly protein PilN